MASNPSRTPDLQPRVELIDNAGDWSVRVIADGCETITSFDLEWFARVFAQEECIRLGVTEITEL